MNCRFCNTPVRHELLDLVNSPPANSFLTLEQLNEPEVYYPLRVLVCENCFLVQIDEYKKSTEIFDQDYVYFSSYSSTWLNHAKQYCAQMVERFSYNSQSKVVEIASNDGYLLQYFLEQNIPVLGIEPTKNTAEVSRSKGIETITEFFGTELAESLVDKGIYADLLIGNNVLAHVPNINDFVAGMKKVLARGGIITMEFPHLIQLLDNKQFDTIYHEHFSYLSLFTVQQIFNSHQLDIFDVDEIPTHGGSLRIFVKHVDDSTKAINLKVSELINKEIKKGVNTLSFYQGFNQTTESIKIELLRLLLEQKKLGKKIAAYGAAAKGNTLLNFCGIKKDLVSFVVDANPSKQNKFLPGSHIPVVDESALRTERPDIIIILPWNLSKEIMNQLSYVELWGAKFLIPIPTVNIV